MQAGFAVEILSLKAQWLVDGLIDRTWCWLRLLDDERVAPDTIAGAPRHRAIGAAGLARCTALVGVKEAHDTVGTGGRLWRFGA